MKEMNLEFYLYTGKKGQKESHVKKKQNQKNSLKNVGLNFHISVLVRNLVRQNTRSTSHKTKADW